jgi:hypothetical protein
VHSQRILIQFRRFPDGEKDLVKHRDNQEPHGPDTDGDGHFRPGGDIAGDVAKGLAF